MEECLQRLHHRPRILDDRLHQVPPLDQHRWVLLHERHSAYLSKNLYNQDLKVWIYSLPSIFIFIFFLWSDRFHIYTREEGRTGERKEGRGKAEGQRTYWGIGVKFPRCRCPPTTGGGWSFFSPLFLFPSTSQIISVRCCNRVSVLLSPVSCSLLHFFQSRGTQWLHLRNEKKVLFQVRWFSRLIEWVEIWKAVKGNFVAGRRERPLFWEVEKGLKAFRMQTPAAPHLSE